MAQKFNIHLNRLDTKQLWEYYTHLMDRYVSLPDKHGSKRNVKLFADIVVDEYFNRIEKLIDVEIE
jgi:hypothetical protein